MLFLGHWKLYDDDFVNDPDGLPYLLNIRADLVPPDTSPFTELAEQIPVTTVIIDFEPHTTLDQAYSSLYTVTETFGPYRLGARCVYIGDPDAHPRWAKDYRVEYAWFADEETIATSELEAPLGTFSPHSWVLGTDPPSYALYLGGVLFGFGRTNSFPDIQYAEFSDLTINGLSPGFAGYSATSGVIRLREGGAGVVGEAIWPGASLPQGLSDGFGPAYQWTERIGVVNTAGNDIGATVTDADGNLRGTPVILTRIHWDVSWIDDPFTAVRSYVVDGDWAGEQDPEFPDSDLAIPLYSPAPLVSLSGEEGFYQPVSVAVEDEIDVQRPDGGRPSDWTSTDDRSTVTDPASGHPPWTEILVTDPGAEVDRHFLSAWRDRVGLGSLGKSDPSFSVDAYETTKHEEGEDVWSWGTYGWMLLEIDAPVAGYLTLTVGGVQLTVEDPHGTEPDRTDGYSASTDTFVQSYTFPVANGPNSVWIDLLFPDGGFGPFYYGRVDDLALSGFEVDDDPYILKGLKLKTKEKGYLKCDFSPPVADLDYSTTVLAQDGAFVLGDWGDQTLKPDEIGETGGSARFVNLNGSTEEQYSLEAFWTQLDKIEGISVEWSQAASDAALKDAFDTTLGPETAQWTRGIVPPERTTPGSAFQPKCSPVVGQVQIVPGIDFGIYTRWPVWGAFETLLATADGTREGAGRVVAAVRVDTGEVVALGASDASGYAIVAPVPANGVTEYRLES